MKKCEKKEDSYRNFGYGKTTPGGNKTENKPKATADKGKDLRVGK